MRSSIPVLKDLVLVGGGHSHVIVLRRLGMRPMPGVRVTVLARDLHAPYSGMLPGFIAGHYRSDDVHIDLAPLARFAGARLFHTEATGLDLERRLVLCANRPPVPYDVVSLDIGIAPALEVPGAADHAVPVKPIGGLVTRWQALAERVRARSGRLRIAVVGAGAAGVELTLAMQHALVAGTASFEAPEFHLFGAAPTVLPSHHRSVRARFDRLLAARGVRTHLGCRVVQVADGRLVLDDGSSFPADEIVWATHAAPQPWPAESGLAVDDHGFITVAPTLESTSHRGVFAAGDVAAVVAHPRAKAGVFAVRQGPPLERNLRRALRGRPPVPFTPQRRFLSLVSTGDRGAVASWGPVSLEGAWVWRWKDWIDRRFMRRFSALPEMAAAPTPGASVLAGLASAEQLRALSTVAMRCGGCGSKVGASLLDRVVTRLEPIRRDEVVVGLDAPDDAAVLAMPRETLVVQSVDGFRSMVDDPHLFGRITANHCLSDLYAMGADPVSALAFATVPYGVEDKMEAELDALLAGAVAVLNEAGAALVGGHTNEGAELWLGFAVTGVVAPDRWLRKGGLRPGDLLVLTKPIGTGTLLAADMRGKAKGRWVDGAIRTMLGSNREAAAILRGHGVRACTDVTGFGLLGHLVEMTKASAMDVRLALGDVPVLAGAVETAAAGWLSSLQPQNVRLRRAVANPEAVSTDPRYLLLFDPQTAGGLLAGVPPARAQDCLARLRRSGYPEAAMVGVVEPQRAGAAPITITIDAP